MKLDLQFISKGGITTPEQNDLLTQLMHRINAQHGAHAEIPPSHDAVDLTVEITVMSVDMALNAVWEATYAARDALGLSLAEIVLYASGEESEKDRLELGNRLQAKWPHALFMERIARKELTHVGKCG